jgi:hypothetical protein
LTQGEPKEGVNPSVIKPGVNGLVRETIQNAWDRKSEGSKVRVEYEILELTGTQLEEFKTAIGWQDLNGHLEAISEQENHERHRAAQALKDLASGRIVLLVVRDHGTGGLDGPEFSGFGSQGNFTKFARDSMVPTQGMGGGSFGIGKSVLWNNSRIRSVVMSSRFRGENGELSRVFGRTYLPTHYLSNGGEMEPYSGHGFWGAGTGGGSSLANL